MARRRNARSPDNVRRLTFEPPRIVVYPAASIGAATVSERLVVFWEAAAERSGSFLVRTATVEERPKYTTRCPASWIHHHDYNAGPESRKPRT